MLCHGVTVVRLTCSSRMDVLPPTEVRHLTILRHLREHFAYCALTHLYALRVDHLVGSLRPQRLVGALQHPEYRSSLFAHPVLFGVTKDGPRSRAGVPLQGKLHGVLEVASIPEEI